LKLLPQLLAELASFTGATLYLTVMKKHLRRFFNNNFGLAVGIWMDFRRDCQPAWLYQGRRS
jgi:zinc transporter ZupT